MGIQSFFGAETACGVDYSDKDGPVFVCASFSGGKVIFARSADLPEETLTSCALPPRLTFLRTLESPFRSTGKSRRIYPSLLDIQMPFSLESCSVSYIQERQHEGKVRCLSVAAKWDAVDACLDQFRNRGVDPVILDSEAVAIWSQSISEIPAGPSVRTVGIVRADAELVSVVIGSDGFIIASGMIDYGDAGRIRRFLSASLASPAAIDWRMCGDPDCRQKAEKLLHDAGDSWVDGIRWHDKPREFLARSLAMRALREGFESVNFRGERLVHPWLSKFRRRKAVALALSLSLCGFLLMLVSLGCVGWMSSVISRRDAAFTSRCEKLAGFRLGAVKGIHALQSVEKAVSARTAKDRPFLAPFEENIQEMLRDIASEAARTGLLVEHASVSYDSVVLEGVSSEWSGADAVKVILERRGFTVDLSRNESLADESVKFKITAGKRRMAL